MLKNGEKLCDMDIGGITLRSVEADGVSISGCNLVGIHFDRVRFRAGTFHLVFLDSALMRSCDFSGSVFQNCVFAGSVLEQCNFTECDLLLCNFLGARISGVLFDHSNLYASRFIGAGFTKTGMRDCNLTRARFDRAGADIDFRSSNTNEALFISEAR